MTTTEPNQLFDALPTHIEDALRASIDRFGVLVPVVKDQHGTIIDGHHRARIANELGVTYRVDTVTVHSDDEAHEIARHLNARRRHLSGDELREHIVMLAQRTTPSGVGELSQNEIADVAGVRQSYVNKVLSDPQVITSDNLPDSRRGNDGKVYPAKRPAKPDPEPEPEPTLDEPPRRPTVVAAKNEREAARAAEAINTLGENAFTGRTYDVKRVERLAREHQAEQRRSEHIEQRTTAGDIDIRHGDFTDALDDLDGTVDAIITDPPYPKEYGSVWGDLGGAAARLLKPNGVLAVMCGTRLELLYAADAAISEHVQRRWMGVYLTPGQRWRDNVERVATGWKPILIYSHPDGTTSERTWINDDVFTSSGTNEADQRFHHWGQNEQGFVQLVDRLTNPGQLVVDPFLGGGTTAVVCRELGRQFVGCDIDAAAVTTSRERLA